MKRRSMEISPHQNEKVLGLFYKMDLSLFYFDVAISWKYWYTCTHNKAVSSVITKYQFDQIMKSIFCYDPGKT